MRTTATALVFAATALAAAGCGPSSNGPSSNGATAAASPTSDTTNAPAASLLLQPSDVPSGLSVKTAPNSSGPLDATGDQHSFGSGASQAQTTMRDAGSADYAGAYPDEVIATDYIFASAADAKTLWSTWTEASGTSGTVLTPPAGAPGEQQSLYVTVNTQYYQGPYQVYTYAFREGNVLASVELWGTPNHNQPSDVVALASKQDAYIRSKLK